MKILFFAILFIVSIVQFCFPMKKIAENTKTQTVLIKDSERVLWEIIIHNTIPHLNDNDTDVLMHTSKLFKDIIFAKKKTSFCNNCAELRSPENQIYLLWEPYARYCARITLDNSIKKSFRSTIYYPCSCGHEITKDEMAAIDFTDYLPCYPNPFVNKRGDICFYFYMNYDLLWHRSKSPEIIQLTFLPGGMRHKPCYLNYLPLSKYKRLLNLGMLIEFPFLLKAILDSSISYDAQWACGRIFDLRGVELPENYQQFQPYPGKTFQYSDEEQSCKFHLFKLLRMRKQIEMLT